MFRVATRTTAVFPATLRPARRPAAFALRAPLSAQFCTAPQPSPKSTPSPAPKLFPSRTRRTPFAVEHLIFNPSQLVIGIGVGGVVASCGGVMYYCYQQGIHLGDLPAIVSQWVSEKGWERHAGFGLPLPLLATGLWTIFLLGSTWLSTRLRLEYRHFVRHVNFSLNGFSPDGRFQFRTLHEAPLDEICFDNYQAAAVMLQAAKRAEPEWPFLELPPQHRWICSHSILNTLSRLTASGFLAADRGLPVEVVRYAYTVTFEKEAGTMRKIRVLLASIETLERIHKSPPSKVWRGRYSQLQSMAETYISQKSASSPAPARPVPLYYVELALPLRTSSTPLVAPISREGVDVAERQWAEGDK
eukprot:TRINITY_DN13872_c0_g1_i1.p1 TRINITY_DN13872_c0_g1~~TRINITY_DN13872_c0_g1_i1.p1  ORF type:complete len:359 (+),score=52.46 TRINITY_DN13872_c0_g1_i1:215-1291(+)